MLVRAVKLQLTGGETLVGALNALVTSKWTSSVVNPHFSAPAEKCAQRAAERD